jgi:hypothetical protein
MDLFSAAALASIRAQVAVSMAQLTSHEGGRHQKQRHTLAIGFDSNFTFQVSMETCMKSGRRSTAPAPLESRLGFWLRFVSKHVAMCFRKLLEAQGATVTERVALRTLLAQRESSHAASFRRLA